MPNLRNWMFFLLAMLAAGLSCRTVALAQDDVYRLAHTEIFGRLRRPAIDFNHEAHAVALETPGCGACHHAPDPAGGKPVYAPDEETACSECHGAEVQAGVPALREAFHGSCTACHRRMLKSARAFKGPTTCGECHRPGQPETR